MGTLYCCTDTPRLLYLRTHCSGILKLIPGQLGLVALNPKALAHKLLEFNCFLKELVEVNAFQEDQTYSR